MSCVILILIVLIMIVLSGKKEGLTTKPDDRSRHVMAETIVHNRSLFTGKNPNFNRAKRHFDWMDPVLYEDVRNLSRNGKLDKDNVIKVLA